MLIHPSTPVEPYDPEPAERPTPDEYADGPSRKPTPAQQDLIDGLFAPITGTVPEDAPF